MAERLLAAARELAGELHPQRRAGMRVALDSSLDRDLGLDSLSRAELLLRIEHLFGARLPERTLAEAETLEDLLEAVLQAGGATPPTAIAAPPLALEAVAVPQDAATLIESLDWHAACHGARTHILLEGPDGADAISYGALRDEGLAVAAGLQVFGLEPDESVAIMLPTGRDYFAAFCGALYAGGVPVPIYPPFRTAQLEEHLRRQARILDNAQAAVLIVPAEALALAPLLKAQVASLRAVMTVGDLRRSDGQAAPVPRRADDRALLQYTSGSTGDPKGVVLSHANLLANIRAMGQAIGVRADDVFVSWLPLYHDLGLIGAWLACLYYAVPTVLLSPLSFLARPASWLQAIHRHRGTISAGPNFAYELCARSIGDRDLDGLDLSSWRLAVNGSEPVGAETVRRFNARFGPLGFRPEAMAPCYGLAECAVALTMPPPGRRPLIDRIRRGRLAADGTAEPAAANESDALEIVACGVPLPEHQLRIVGEDGRELEERREGRLQFRGPSATSGYFRNEEKTAALFDGGWLETGDLAYVARGDLYLTGRSKDVIIRAGRKLHPHELEAAVGALPEIIRGGVAVFGSRDPATHTERVVVLAETTAADAVQDVLRRRIDDAATLLLGAPPDDVVLAPPDTVLKTASGKIRRAACRELYERGRIGAPRAALRWQVMRLRATAATAWLRGRWRSLGARLYAGWWWSIVGLVAGLCWLLVIVLRRRTGCWAVVHGCARWLLRLTGTGLSSAGTEHLPPAGAAVVVVNHSSYLDVVVLAAAIARPPVFVAKRELEHQLFSGPFLRRLRTLFVERVEAGRGAEDVGQALAALREGELAVFFPEGTLSRRPGLLPFRLGAFRVAAEAGVPVIPLALRGTRSILRGGQWFPRRGAVAVTVAPPIQPAGSDFAAAVALRDAARGELLRLVGEPDLAAEHVTMPGAAA